MPVKNRKLEKYISISRKGIRAFLFCVLTVLLFWIFMTGSEEYRYSLPYALHIELKDNKNHTIHQSVSTVDIQFQSNGIEALFRKNNHKRKELHLIIDNINLKEIGNIFLVNLKSYTDNILSQFKISNSQKPVILTNTIRIPLNSIERKKVKVDLKNVHYHFAPQYGPYGNPVLFPETVTIEGESSAVRKTQTVEVKPYDLKNLTSSKVHYLHLDSILHIKVSPSFIALYIPTDKYTETTVTVPVNVISDSKKHEIKTHPETVQITVMVALKDYDKVTPELFLPVVNYTDTAYKRLPVKLSQFPNFVRIQKISPQEVQYVIVK